MNPIENVWKVLKDELSSIKVSTKDEMIEKINICGITTTAINSVNSMSVRVKLLLKNKGMWTKY